MIRKSIDLPMQACTAGKARSDRTWARTPDARNFVRALVATTLAAAAAGCGKANNVELQLPLVIPLVGSGNAALSVSVKNFSQAQWMGGKVEMYGWYNPNPNDTSSNIQKAVYFQGSQAIGPLAPGGSTVAFNAQAIASFPLQAGSIPGSSCVKDSCNGHLHVILKELWGVQATPPYTHVSITWTKSILLAEETIKDEGP